MIPGTAWQPCASEGRPPTCPRTPGAAKRYQWKNDSASWAPDAPTDTQTGGGNLRWMNPVGGLRRTRYQGLAKKSMAGYLVAKAHNLVRTAKLLVSAQEETPVTQAG
jgi:uncharacterized protein (DUF2235 family)